MSQHSLQLEQFFLCIISIQRCRTYSNVYTLRAHAQRGLQYVCVCVYVCVLSVCLSFCLYSATPGYMAAKDRDQRSQCYVGIGLSIYLHKASKNGSQKMPCRVLGWRLRLGLGLGLGSHAIFQCHTIFQDHIIFHVHTLLQGHVVTRVSGPPGHHLSGTCYM